MSARPLRQRQLNLRLLASAGDDAELGKAKAAQVKQEMEARKQAR